MTPDDKRVHPLRRKHRRGKRGGKKHRKAPPGVVFLVHDKVIAAVPPPADVVASLRKRLALLAHGTARKAG